MTRRRRSRSELVIGMTLAEVFLLLLIVGWYGTRLESEAGKPSPTPTPADVLKARLEEVEQSLINERAANEQLRGRLSEMEKVLTWLGETLGMPIRTQGDAQEAVETFRARVAQEARRGKPSCTADNVLIDVTADSGNVQLRFNHAFSKEKPAYSAGQTLTDDTKVGVFLAAVGKYYDERRTAGTECAYDFRLRWRTDNDYRISRERFEQFFYPARVVRIQ